MYVRYYDHKADKSEAQNAEVFSKWETFTSPLGKAKKKISFKDVVDYSDLVRLEINHRKNLNSQFSIEKIKAKKMCLNVSQLLQNLMFLMKFIF